MNTFKKPLALVAVSIAYLIATSGCMLDRRSLNSFADLTPRQYCPGDELTASYDFLRELSCTGTDCPRFAPTVTINSSPALFPTQTINDYRGSTRFPASGDSVTVSFAVSSSNVLIPSDTGLVNRERYPNPQNITANRYNNEEQAINHEGICAGATPDYAAGEFWSTPLYSARLRPNQICNRNGVAIYVSFVSAAAPTPPRLMLSPGDCDAIPAGVDSSFRVAVQPVTPDLSAMCSATASRPPSGLSTSVTYSCAP